MPNSTASSSASAHCRTSAAIAAAPSRAAPGPAVPTTGAIETSAPKSRALEASALKASALRTTDGRHMQLVWRPSRYVLLALAALTLLAVVALWASELPALAAWPLSVLVLAYGMHLLRCEAERPEATLLLAGNGARTTVDGAPVRAFRVSWRGPLAFADWRDQQGRRQRLSWWPDTLSAEKRRELRLAAPGGGRAYDGESVAP